MTRRPRYRSSTTLRLSCIGSAPRTCASNTHRPIAQTFRELRSQDAPGRSTCSWPSPEIRTYGTHSVQVCRRLRSLLNGLLVVAAPDRRECIRAELSPLDESIAKGFPDAASLAIARASDPQGIGAPAMEWTYTYRGRRH